MRTEDGHIIHKCLNGEPEAFGFLVDKYKESVYAFAYTKLRNFHDAEDVTQEVFIKAYQKLRTLRRWDNFLAWIYAITSNLCKNWVRARSRRPDHEFMEDKDQETLEILSIDSYRERLARESLHESLQEALDSLPEAYRQVLTLYYLGGMSNKEIARFLGTSPTAVKQRLMRARSRLKKEMLAMMSATYEGQRLPTGFTFRIVEAVKRIKIHPMPRMTGLPWGLSLAAGIILTFLSLGSHVRLLNPMAPSMSSPFRSEAKVLKTGDLPVDMLEISQIPVIASKQLDGEGGEAMSPKLQNANAHAAEVKLTPNNVKAEDQFGRGCIHGDYIIAGAHCCDGEKGAAYIFKRDGTAWREQAMLTAKDGSEGDWFGWSAVITDDYAIVGAPGDDDMGEDTGSVYIFRFNGGTWIEAAKLKPHGNAIKWCNFGNSISISGNYLIVGSPNENWAGGAIYIFECIDGKWGEKAKLISSDWAQFDSLGLVVSISGDYAIAGAPQHASKKGSAYIFKRTGDSWKEQAVLVASDGEADDWFGYSVSISGDYAMVGANGDKDKGQWSGSAYIFYNDGASWKQQTKLVSSDLSAGDCFGSTVCISGDYALVGAPVKDGEAGAVYAFLRRGTSWEERAKISLGKVPNRFGQGISISGNYAVVGAPLHNSKEGAVYIYNCITDLSLPVETTSHTPTTLGGVKSRLGNDVDIPDEGARHAVPLPSIPVEFRLLQNYPNPLNPETWLPYELASDANVTIWIYNSGGGLVRKLSLGMQEPGSYITKDKAAYWDGRNEEGELVASDVYFYVMEAGESTDLRKMVIMR